MWSRRCSAGGECRRIQPAGTVVVLPVSARLAPTADIGRVSNSGRFLNFSGRSIIGVEDNRLKQAFGEVGPKVMGFDLPTHVISVEAKAIEVEARGVQRRAILWETPAGRQWVALRAQLVASAKRLPGRERVHAAERQRAERRGAEASSTGARVHDGRGGCLLLLAA
jgi:hypothetical protein